MLTIFDIKSKTISYISKWYLQVLIAEYGGVKVMYVNENFVPYYNPLERQNKIVLYVRC